MLAAKESTVPVCQTGTAGASNDIIIQMHEKAFKPDTHPLPTPSHTHIQQGFRIPTGISSIHATSAVSVICVTLVSSRNSSKWFFFFGGNGGAESVRNKEKIFKKN